MLNSTQYWIDYTRDLLGRVTQEDAPISESQTSGAITSVAYEGLTTKVTNPESQLTTYDRDSIGRMVKVTDDLGGETEYEYNAFDQLTKVWDPANATTTIAYNNRGDKTSLIDPDMGTWTYEYTVFGELKKQTDAKSQIMTMVYDQLGRLTSRTEPEGTTTFTYYAADDWRLGLPYYDQGPNGYLISRGYDLQRRLNAETVTINGTQYVTNYWYGTSEPEKGKLAQVTYPASTSGYRHKVDYEYDSLGLVRVKDAGSSTVYVELHQLDPWYRERLSTLGNGLDEDRVYDFAAGTLKSIKAGPNLTATIQDLAYQWDKVGNLTERQDLNQTLTETFTFDDLNRLKTASLGSTQTLSLNYSATGNIDYKSDVGTYTNTGDRVTEITGTRASKYDYDANGNLICRGSTVTSPCPSASDAITWYSYNKPNKIEYGSDKAEFSYGPDRSRVQTNRSYGEYYNHDLLRRASFRKRDKWQYDDLSAQHHCWRSGCRSLRAPNRRFKYHELPTPRSPG